jgi:hypothetical protein
MGFRKRGESPKGEYVRLLRCCWRTACWAAEALGSVKALKKKPKRQKASGDGKYISLGIQHIYIRELSILGDEIFKTFRLTQWHYWKSGKLKTS